MDNEITFLEEQLKEYKQLFYNSATPTVITTINGDYLEYNKSYLKLFGYKEDMDLTTYPPQSGSPKYQKNNKLSIEESQKKIAYTIKHGSNEFEWLHQKTDGEVFESLVELTKIKFNSQDAIKVKIKDISEKRKLERLVEEKTRDLNEQKELFARVINEYPYPIILKNWEGKFTLVNQALADLYDTTTEDMIGKDDSYYLKDSSLTTHYKSNVQKIMSEGKTKIVYEDSIDKKTGERRNYISIKKPFKDFNDEPNILVITNDITEINKANEEIKKKERMLFEQSKMASMGEMLANIAHQWRQPLSIISTITSNLSIRKKMGIIDQDEEISNLEKVTNTIQYLSHTIDDFSDFFKPDKEIKTCKSDTIIEKVFSLISERFDNYDIRIIKEIDNFEFRTLENELIQVILNILNNARDALTEKSNNRVIIVKTYKKDEFIYFEVHDNAGGIPKKIINKIFEPYFTTKHQSQGTGIGLYMSDQIIKKHLKGEILVKNKKLVLDNDNFTGARFKIKIPMEITSHKS